MRRNNKEVFDMQYSKKETCQSWLRRIMVAFVFLFVCVQLLTLCVPTAYAAGGGKISGTAVSKKGGEPLPGSTWQYNSWQKDDDPNTVGCGWRCSTISPEFGYFYFKVKSTDWEPDEEDGTLYYYPKYFHTPESGPEAHDANSVIGNLTLYCAAGGMGASGFSIACAAQGVNPETSIAAMGVEIFSLLNIGDGSLNIINLGTSVYESLAVIGLLLVILYFIIDVLDEMQADHFTVDHLIKKLITMAVAILVISQGPIIFANIIRFGDEFMNDVSDAFARATLRNNSELQQAYENMMYTDGLFGIVEALADALGLMVDNIVAYLFSYVALLFAYLTAFSRFLEIIIRFAMAPIGLAPLVSGGAKGSGMRYLKKFASVCIQGAVCVAALAAATALSLAMQDGVSAVIAQVLVPLTLIGFMAKTQGIADDIVGV